jgi:hypothetical protein
VALDPADRSRFSGVAKVVQAKLQVAASVGGARASFE